MTEEQIRKSCFKLVSDLFDINLEKLTGKEVFGIDLKYQILKIETTNEKNYLFDILDEVLMFNPEIKEKYFKNIETNACINTLDDYCNLVIICYKYEPKDVMCIFKEGVKAKDIPLKWYKLIIGMFIYIVIGFSIWFLVKYFSL